MRKILIIEDDTRLCTFIKQYFEENGFAVIVTEDFININEQVEKVNPDIILLDINLPYVDGYYICREIRNNSNIPIIIISARSGDKDQMLAIDLGADDYVTKPFKMEMLSSKIKAVLRRAYGEYAIKINTEIEGICVDEKNFKVVFKEKEVSLSKNELKLVKKLIDNPNMVVKRSEFFEELWDESKFVDDNTLTVNITRIKNIFKELGIQDIIKTKRGVGYIFDTSALK